MSNTIEVSEHTSIEVDGDIRRDGRIVAAHLNGGRFEVHETHDLSETQSNAITLIAAGVTRKDAMGVIGRDYYTTIYHVDNALRNLGQVGVNAAVSHLFDRSVYETTDQAGESGMALLTSAELEILASAADGATIKEITAERMVSEGTVRTQLKNLMKKLQVHTIAGATTILRMHQQFESMDIVERVMPKRKTVHTLELDDETSFDYYGNSFELGRITRVDFNDGIFDVDPSSRLPRRFSRALGFVAIGSIDRDASEALGITTARYKSTVEGLKRRLHASMMPELVNTAFEEGYLRVAQESGFAVDLSVSEQAYLRSIASGMKPEQAMSEIGMEGINPRNIEHSTYGKLFVTKATQAVTTAHLTGNL